MRAMPTSSPAPPPPLGVPHLAAHDAPAFRPSARFCPISGRRGTGRAGARRRRRRAPGLAKVANVYVPIVYGRAVDALAPEGTSAADGGPGGADHRPTACCASPRSGFGELRDAVFATVQQRAVRKLALQTFDHLHRAVAALPPRPADRRPVAGDRARHDRASQSCCGSRCSTSCRPCSR